MLRRFLHIPGCFPELVHFSWSVGIPHHFDILFWTATISFPSPSFPSTKPWIRFFKIQVKRLHKWFTVGSTFPTCSIYDMFTYIWVILFGQMLVSMNGFWYYYPIPIQFMSTILQSKISLMVWNMFFFLFPYLGYLIIPTDEVTFFRGLGFYQQPENPPIYVYIYIYYVNIIWYNVIQYNTR